MSSPTPSATAYAVAGIIVGLTIGYFVGQASTTGIFVPKRAKEPKGKAISPREADDTEESGSSDDESMDGELQDFSSSWEECKLVLVVRTDLGMTKGKIAAQCGHATLACYNYFLDHAPNSPILRRWKSYGQAKVAVQCKSEEDMLTMQAQAISLGLCARVIRDQGRTQIPSGSSTVLGIGPAPKSIVDQVTGSLKLL